MPAPGYDLIVKAPVKALACVVRDGKDFWNPVTLMTGERLVLFGVAEPGDQSGQYQFMSDSRRGVLRVEFSELMPPERKSG